MTRLVSFSGVAVEAAPEAVPRLLKSGMFFLAEGEAVPEAEQEREPVEGKAEEGGELSEGFDFGAFGDENPDETAPDLSGMTNAELRALAGERGVAVPSKANKATLISLIEEGA